MEYCYFPRDISGYVASDEQIAMVEKFGTMYVAEEGGVRVTMYTLFDKIYITNCETISHS